MPYIVQNSGSSLRLDDGNSIENIPKKEITISSQGNNVRLSWENGKKYVIIAYTDFTSPTGASAAAVAAIIEAFLDSDTEGTGNTIRVDETDANNVYVGEAKLGSATSAAVWMIKKITIASSITSILFAGGDDYFDNIWDNRASLIYS